MMKIRLLLILIVVCLLAAAAAALQAADAPGKPNAPETSIGEKDACLQCHGPFDDLAARAKNFTAEDGEKINPHHYVPHDRKDAGSVPVCTNCHKPHPMPLESKKDVPKTGISWCYGCHHTEEFKGCKACHR